MRADKERVYAKLMAKYPAWTPSLIANMTPYQQLVALYGSSTHLTFDDIESAQRYQLGRQR